MEEQREQPIGIIEALSTAYALVTERIWLLFIPWGLEFMLWLGPRVSARPVFQRIAGAIMLPPEVATQQSDLAQQAELMREMLTTIGQQFNVLSLLVARLIGVPGLLADFPELAETQGMTVTIQSPLMLVTMGVLIGLVGLFIACLWFGLLARTVQSPSSRPGLDTMRYVVGKAGHNALRLCLLVLLIILIAVAVMVPISIVLTIISFVSPQFGVALSGLFSIAVLWAALWVGIHLYFVVEAIVLHDVGPWPAVRNSFRVVRHNFWSALLLIVLIFIIGQGFGFIWVELAKSPPGLLLAIAGNTYIGTGLTMGVLVYYDDRYRYTERARRETQDV